MSRLCRYTELCIREDLLQGQMPYCHIVCRKHRNMANFLEHQPKDSCILERCILEYEQNLHA